MVIRFRNPLRSVKWCDAFLLFYLCVLLGNQQDFGVDAKLIRMSFYLLTIYIMFFEMVLNRKYKLLLYGIFPIWLAVYIIYPMTSSYWAIKPSVSLALLPQFGQCIIVSIAIYFCYRTKQDFEKLLNITLFAALYSLVIVISRTPEQLIGVKRLGEYSGINANSFGLIMSIAFVISYFLLTTNTKKRLLYLVLCGVFAYFALNSGSKKAFLSLLFGVLILAVYSPKNGLRKVTLIIFSIGVIVVLYYLILNNSAMYSIIGVRMEAMFATLSNVSETTTGSTALRMRLVREAQVVFLKHPFVGIGVNNFFLVSSMGVYTHNNYWEILATLGIVGFVVNYSIYCHIFRKSLYIYRKYKDPLVSLGLTLMLVRMIVDYGQVTFYKPFFAFLISMVFTYINSIYGGSQYEIDSES